MRWNDRKMDHDGQAHKFNVMFSFFFHSTLIITLTWIIVLIKLDLFTDKNSTEEMKNKKQVVLFIGFYIFSITCVYKHILEFW